jgi:dolichol-phosphate mannosyltransferase
MDSDLQDRPQVIPDLFKKAQEGFDVVFVSRTQRPESLFYRALQKTFYFLLKFLSGLNFDSTQANFSIISRKVVEAFKQFPEQARFYGSTINWLGFKRASIQAVHGQRFSGKPSYTIKKRFKLASDIILAFSDRPLKFAIYLGLIMVLVSAIVLSWIVYGLLKGGFSVTGWASLIASIFLIGGVQIFLIGIIGIYLSRIFGQVKNRPLYVIDIKKNL